LWRLVEELTPSLRTYGLAAERKDKYLRDSQLWAAKQAQMAERQGDTEAAKQATQRYDRLANQRIQETLPAVYPELSPAQRALLALEVQPPRAPHPAQVAKLKRFHATAKLAVAEDKRQAQEALQEQARQLWQAGLDKRDAARQLEYAGYTPNEAWTAVQRVWPTSQVQRE
jgi:hypothetical protein